MEMKRKKRAGAIHPNLHSIDGLRAKPLLLGFTLSALTIFFGAGHASAAVNFGCSSNIQCSGGAVCELPQGSSQLDEMLGGSCVIKWADGIKISLTMELDKGQDLFHQSDRSGKPLDNIYFTGTITHQTVVHLQQILARYPSRVPKMGTRPPFEFWIDSPGGNVYAAMELGRILRANQAWISISWDARCASACVLTWAGAAARTIAPGARLIIHRPYNFADAGETLAASSTEWHAMQADIRQYLMEMNIPATLLDAMNQVPPEAGHVLTDAELSYYLLSEDDPAWQELVDSNAASKLGISRTKYVELKARYNRCIETTQASYVSCARVFSNLRNQ